MRRWSMFFAIVTVALIVTLVMLVANVLRTPEPVLIPARSCEVSFVLAPGVAERQPDGSILAGPGGCGSNPMDTRDPLVVRMEGVDGE